MDREMMGQVLAELIPGDSTEIDEVTLGMLFPPGEAAGVIDQRTRTAATRFAREHGCGLCSSLKMKAATKLLFFTSLRSEIRPSGAAVLVAQRRRRFTAVLWRRLVETECPRQPPAAFSFIRLALGS
jgi:hypothetical protein